ncbi:pantetheine-phosphate adenylyltransferase [Propionicicella superfundia]|uniref:pantetheine-phosphate adenylyltransferase n=1 Tax=Propionicicella superfundia TaxID=348582 RepID=UPI00056CB7A2|nr:pantetheine-phosphate adenylyltransferase [Propionicicella superfundia]
MRVVCPGSFDPITLGHVDIIERAAACFSEVIVAVAQNSAKNHMFEPAERVELVEVAVGHLPNVSVHALSGLLVDFCVAHDASALVKGVRTAGDYEYEAQMAQWNRTLKGIETLLVPTAPQWSYLSSTKVREVATLGGDVRAYVPAAVADRIRTWLAERPVGRGKEPGDG